MPVENQYVYSYKRPKPNSIELWEISNPIGHRLVLKVRRSRIVLPPNHLSYQARCTCKWASEEWFRSHMTARKDFMTNHIGPVRQQGRLL